MSVRSSDPITTAVSVTAWSCVAAFSFWVVWQAYDAMQIRHFWFAIPIGLMLALVAGGYAVESLAQEMTVRRWAVSQLVFTVLAVVFLVAGIFNADIVHIGRWVLVAGGAVFGIAAAFCAAAAKDLF